MSKTIAYIRASTDKQDLSSTFFSQLLPEGLHVVDDINNTPCTNLKPPGYEVFGCEIPHRNIFGLINTSIYILKENSGKYSDACLTFIYVTYHEIGHTLYQMRYGIPSKEDDIYRKSLETYADGIADKYGRFDKTKKEGCKEYYLAQEVEKANQTLNIAREKLESAREKLKSAKDYLDSTEIDIQNAKTIVESDNSNVVQTGNEFICVRLSISMHNFDYFQKYSIAIFQF